LILIIIQVYLIESSSYFRGFY